MELISRILGLVETIRPRNKSYSRITIGIVFKPEISRIFTDDPDIPMETLKPGASYVTERWRKIDQKYLQTLNLVYFLER